MILETERIYLREMNQSDYLALCKIVHDKDVMYAYNGVFNHEETQNLLDRQILSYKENGFGLWAVVLKETDEMIGQCGITFQNYKQHQLLEVGYLFQKAFWHKGYATEAAIACKQYAFNVLKADEVFSIIRDTNIASQNVATRNGMVVIDTFVKRYCNADMPHYLFSAKKPT